jgi:hypothetical protein
MSQIEEKLNRIVEKLGDDIMENMLDEIKIEITIANEKSSEQLNVIISCFKYIANEIQKCVVENSEEIDLRKMQTAEIIQVTQNCLEMQKYTIEQSKVWLNEMNNNLTNRIADIKSYLLQSNQAMREMISNGICELLKEFRTGKNDYLTMSNNNLELLNTKNSELLSKLEQRL